MTERIAQPLLFDTSAESRLGGMREGPEARNVRRVFETREMAVSAVTVLERIRGFAIACERAEPARRVVVNRAKAAYLSVPRRIVPVDTAAALVAGELMAMLPVPPSPAKRSHRGTEHRAERLARWRFDILIAATAAVGDWILIHENATDFDAIRDAFHAKPERFPGVGPLVTCRLSEIGALLH